MNHPGYETLAAVLQEAFDQAATGKGAERHANALPFHEQPMQRIARRRGLGFLLGQVDKKTEEAQGMLERGERAAWRREILGAINYLAGALIYTDGLSESSETKRADSPGVGWSGSAVRPEPGRDLEVLMPGGCNWRVPAGTPFPTDAAFWRYVD